MELIITLNETERKLLEDILYDWMDTHYETNIDFNNVKELYKKLNKKIMERK